MAETAPFMREARKQWTDENAGRPSWTGEHLLIIIASNILVSFLTINLGLPDRVTVTLQGSQHVKHPHEVRVRFPRQHHNNCCQVDEKAADEDGNSPCVLSESTQWEGEHCIRDAKTDHDETNAMDSDWTCHKRLCHGEQVLVLYPVVRRENVAEKEARISHSFSLKQFLQKWRKCLHCFWSFNKNATPDAHKRSAPSMIDRTTLLWN